MNLTEKINKYRMIPCLCIFAVTLLTSAILSLLWHLQMDEIFCVAMVVLWFLPVLLFEMSYERRRGRLSHNIQTTYGRIVTGFCICCVLLLAVSFLPEFFRPVMLFPLIMIAFSNEKIGFWTGIFFNVLLALTTGGSFHELLAYTLMTALVCVLADALKHSEYRISIGCLFLFSNVLLSALFCYLTNEKISSKQLLYALGVGVITCLYTVFLFPKNQTKTEEEIAYHYKALLTEDSPLIANFKTQSPEEYAHAKKVANIAQKYALTLEMRSDLAAAAGMYYHFGEEKAMEHCFPMELIQIIKECGAKTELPSTPESALIHMIDGILLKIEALDMQEVKSWWNREVFIYQTLNEYSTSGIYDASGLSINAFIKIRELLAREDLLS